MSILFAILLGLAAVLWIAFIAGSLSLHGSDAAGNGLSRAFAMLAGIALWALLALLLVVAAIAGEMPAAAAVAAVLLVPASGFAAQAALQAMIEDRRLKWPAIAPAALPGVIIAYALWCFFPSLQATIGPALAGGVAGGSVLVLSALPFLARLSQARARARQEKITERKTPEETAAEEARREEERRRQAAASFHSLTSDSPLWEWWSYTDPGSDHRTEALEGARTAKSRQADAVRMLGQYKRSLFLAVPRLDLEATAEIENAIRGFLEDQVKSLLPYDPAKPMATSVVTEWFEDYFPTIRWLVDNHRSCEEELSAIAAAVARYPDGPERQAFLAALQGLRASSA